MNFITQCPYGKQPIRTTNHPSPSKQSGSNRQLGQPQTRAPVDNAIQHELAEARFIAHDLADQMFGHLVPTDMAKDILTQFIADGVVQVYEGTSSRSKSATALDAKCKDIQNALDAALEDAKAHGCIWSDAEGDGGNTELRQAGKKGKKPQEQGKSYSWRWRDFPSEPIGEDKFVAFLNGVIDRALEVAQTQPGHERCKLRHRFAAPKDKHHAVPLAYEADGEDMRPDFLVLPIDAFSSDLKTVDQKYVNFTALRAVGESKNKDFGSGLSQVHRYARGIKRAQPWVHFVVALTVTKDRAALLRGESSGTERLELALTDGRGCIEFVRILLGLALAEGEDLGQNPNVALATERRSCKVSSAAAPPPHSTMPRPVQVSYRESKATATSSAPSCDPGSASMQHTSELVPSRSSGLASHTSDASVPPLSKTSGTASSTSKRGYSEVDNSDDEGEDKQKPGKKMKITHVDRTVFIPLFVYDYKCVGILFTASSIRGRGTTVFCVVDLEDKDRSRPMALKMSWQDLEREVEHNEVLERLEKNKPHRNVVVPFRNFKASRKNETCATLGAIRAFLDDQLTGFPVENRVLSVSVSELKRPVKYFWGVHDFVRGIRGAVLGHEYLTEIGVLHRDVSENNVVLARRPGGERGYLIDFDMAILQEPQEPSDHEDTSNPDLAIDLENIMKSSSPIPPDDTKPLRALRTGTTPYMSFNVLFGRKHTHYDDLESFLYVLLLFFFSYAGPLSNDELRDADERGFVQCLGSGRLTHMRRWPDKYAMWADGDLSRVAESKDSSLGRETGSFDLIRSAEVRHCLKSNWPAGLHGGIVTLLFSCWSLFANSRISPRLNLPRTQVTHRQFIGRLDDWLDKFSGIEDEFSNCPFNNESL